MISDQWFRRKRSFENWPKKIVRLKRKYIMSQRPNLNKLETRSPGDFPNQI